MTEPSMIERLVATPRWALERAEEEQARAFGCVPDPRNVDMWLRNPSGWLAYLVLAAYIARMERSDKIDAASAEDR